MRRARPALRLGRLWPGRHLGAAPMLAAALAMPGAMAPDPAQAASPAPVRITVGAPEGFDSLTGPQKTLVDVYFGDRKIGQAAVTYQPGSLRFENPDRVTALLPQLTDPGIVRASLAASELASNAHKICTPGADPNQCGRLQPAVAGIIFDEQRFRVTIFVNRRFLQISQATRIEYIPRPQAGVSMLNALSAVMSGSNRTQNIYNVQNRLLIGESDKRIRADVAYSTGFGIQADQIVAEIDRPGWRFSGGAFWTQGSSLVGRRKILGVGAATQFDTRIDKDEMLGTPLMVFLDQRAKVDILRDGRMIASRIYEAGNQAVDTSGLPDGSYEVVLRIEEAGGAVREERRFFARNRQIAPVGHSIYYAYAGVLVDDFSRKFLSPTRTPFAQVGGGWRISTRIALDANLIATNKTVVGEFGATFISRAAQLQLGGVVSSNGTRGGYVHVGSSGNSRLNFDFDLRHIRTADDSLTNKQPPPVENPVGGLDLARLPIARRTYTQLVGSLNYSLTNGQFGVAATWRRERGQVATYNVGPWVRMNLVRRGPWQLSFQGDYSISREGKSGFVGLSLRFLGTRSTFGGETGFRSRNPAGSQSRSGPVGSLYGSWNRDRPDGTDIELAGGYDRDLDRQLVNSQAVLRTPQAQLAGNVIHTLSGAGGGGTQYGLGFQTTIALRGGKLAMIGKNRNDSMMLVDIEGDNKDARFEVLVNESAVGTVRAGSSLPVSVTPYRQYNVRLRPLSSELLQYDATAQSVGLYPGNVTRLTWPVRRLVAMFGRLTFANGQPVGAAQVRTEGGIGQTDNSGYFQIEAGDGAELTALLPDGRSCKIQPPRSSRGEQFVKLGTLICNPSPSQQPFTTALRSKSGP